MSAEGARDPEKAAPRRAPGAGLCPTCRHARPVTSAKGSTFLRCGLSDADRTYRRYPPQPVLVCRGHER
jgi:hypothetical protein